VLERTKKDNMKSCFQFGFSLLAFSLICWQCESMLSICRQGSPSDVVLCEPKVNHDIIEFMEQSLRSIAGMKIYYVFIIEFGLVVLVWIVLVLYFWVFHIHNFLAETFSTVLTFLSCLKMMPPHTNKKIRITFAALNHTLSNIQSQLDGFKQSHTTNRSREIVTTRDICKSQSANGVQTLQSGAKVYCSNGWTVSSFMLSVF